MGHVLPVAAVVSAYRSGLSGAAIAAQYGVHPCSVVNLLRRHGEPRRSLTEASRLAWESGRACAPWKGKRLSRAHRRKPGHGASAAHGGTQRRRRKAKCKLL